MRNEKGQFVKGYNERVGKKLSDETKKKIGDAHRGKHHTISDETRKKISKSLKGKKHSEERRKAESLGHLGQRHPSLCGPNSKYWKGGITPINKRLRRSPEFVRWRKAVFVRFEVSNGITLCPPCHKKTDSYGRKSKQPKI